MSLRLFGSLKKLVGQVLVSKIIEFQFFYTVFDTQFRLWYVAYLHYYKNQVMGFICFQIFLHIIFLL